MSKHHRLLVEVIDTHTFLSTIHRPPGELVRIGRGPAVECEIPCPSLLPEHVRLFLDRNEWHLSDGGSAGETHLLAPDKSWQRVTGQVQIHLPAQIKLSNQYVLRISSADSERDGADISAVTSEATVSQVKSIGSVESVEAFLVLDMCDSSSLASVNEAMAYHLKKRMRVLVQPLLVGSGAQYIQSTGDGWLATFPKAQTAVRVARRILRDLDARNRTSKNPPIRVRIALHVGKTYVMDSRSHDRHGSDLNLTFRIEGVQAEAFKVLERPLPEENRLLCSRAFVECYVAEGEAPDLRPLVCGWATLKGFENPVEILLLPWMEVD